MSGSAPTLVALPAPAPGAEAAPVRTRWRDDRVGVAVGIVFGLACFGLGWLRFAHHWSTSLDLGLFDQGTWQLAHFHAPYLTIIDDNLFGDHVSAVMVLFAPLYRLRATPLWLVATQSAALGLAVPALRDLARELRGSAALATVATVLSAPLLAAATYDFHPVVLTVPVVAWALAAAHRDDLRAVTIAAALVVFIRADAGVLLLGVAVLSTPRIRRRLVTIALPAMAVGALVPVLLGTNQTFTRYWSELGSSPTDAVLHPWRVPIALVSPPALVQLSIWLLPVGFLAVARRRWAGAILLAGFPLILGTNGLLPLPWFHDAAALVPFCIGGAVAVLAAPRRRWERPALLVAGCLVALVIDSPLAPRAPRPLRLTAIVHDRGVPGLHAALALVRPDDRVVAVDWIVPRVAERSDVYQYPCLVTGIDQGACHHPLPGPPPTVVVTSEDHAAALRRAGWRLAVMPGGRLVVARWDQP